MNWLSRNQARKALDTAIAQVAENELRRLSSPLSCQETASQICRALRELRDLKKGKMPEYDEWVALFYAVWYQPIQINLAFTLTKKILKSNNTLSNGSGSLQVIDFGCGALAMQLGLALATAASYQGNNGTTDIRQPLKINVEFHDESEDMIAIGKKIWAAFLHEISSTEKYSNLDGLRYACYEIQNGITDGDSVTDTWLTAFHVVYEASNEKIKSSMTRLSDAHSPDLILVTSHDNRWDVKNSFAPRRGYYRCSTMSCVWSYGDLLLKGKCVKINQLRSRIYVDNIEPMMPLEDCYSFVPSYLKSTRLWGPEQHTAKVRLYLKDCT